MFGERLNIVSDIVKDITCDIDHGDEYEKCMMATMKKTNRKIAKSVTVNTIEDITTGTNGHEVIG